MSSIKSLRLIVSQLPVWLMAVALFMPAVGPLVDHHFAERQPGHLHFGDTALHFHPHDYQQVHFHAPVNGEPSGRPVALYRADGASAAITVVVVADFDSQFAFNFEPESVFFMPVAPETQAKHNYISPLVQPPQPVL